MAATSTQDQSVKDTPPTIIGITLIGQAWLLFYLPLHIILAITFAMKLDTMAVYSTVLMAAPLNLYIVFLALKRTSLFLLLYCLFQL